MTRGTGVATLALAIGWSACGGPRGDGGSPARGHDAFVTISPRDSRYFELSDGSPYIPIGLNIAFPRFLLDEDAVVRKMEERMRKLSENGGNFIGIWLSHPFYDVEHERAGMYDSRKIRRLNRILDAANRYSIRVRLTLEHFRTLEEVEPLFPGAAAMGKPIHHVSRGGPAKNTTEFFQVEKSRQRFQRKLTWFAEKYRENPAIFAWELWNEIDTVDGDGWREWTADMLPEVHRLFPNHLAVQGFSSLDFFRKRNLFSSVWKIAGNDVTQVHRYLDPAAQLEICRGPMDLLIADAIEFARSATPRKPILLSQAGAVKAGDAGPSELYEADRLGTILHDIIYTPFFTGAAGTGQSWHWRFYVEKHDLWHHFGRFAEMVEGIDPPAETFEPAFMETERVRIYTLRGKKTFLAWVRDKEADWRTDIVENAARPVRNAVLDLNAVEGGAPSGRVRLFSPWTGEWTDAQAVEGKIELPSFFRSYVVRIDS